MPGAADPALQPGIVAHPDRPTTSTDRHPHCGPEEEPALPSTTILTTQSQGFAAVLDEPHPVYAALSAAVVIPIADELAAERAPCRSPVHDPVPIAYLMSRDEPPAATPTAASSATRRAQCTTVPRDAGGWHCCPTRALQAGQATARQCLDHSEVMSSTPQSLVDDKA